MQKFRFRSFLDNALFVVVIMAAAIASAALDAGALMGAMPKTPSALAQAAPAAPAAASAIQLASRGALVARR